MTTQDQFTPHLLRANTRSGPHFSLIEADLANRRLTPNTRQLYLFLWRAKTQNKRLPLGLIFSESTLAKETFMSVRTVRRGLRCLEAQGLLQVSPRHRTDGGTTSNRYDLTWRPMTVAPEPRSMQAPAIVPETIDELNDNLQPDNLPPDAVFVWPNVSGAPQSSCPGEGEPEMAAGTSLCDDSSQAILDQETYSKSDQLLPDGPIRLFESAAAFRLFLFSKLTAVGIRPQRVTAWVRQYGLARVAQATSWVLSAPKGQIRFPGGWMHRALMEDWTAPRWVTAARENRRREAVLSAQSRAQREQEALERQRIVASRQAFEASWESLEPHLTELPELLAAAERQAQSDLGTMFPMVYRPGSPTWKTFIIRTAVERPELLGPSEIRYHLIEQAG